MTRIHALALIVSFAAACGGPEVDLAPPEEGPPADLGAIELPCDDSDVYYPDFDDQLDGRAGDLGAWRCGRVDMAWDPANPDDTFSLGYVKLPATDPAKRRGTLIFNPGGPGGSGTELAPIVAARLPAEILEAYDLVGFDPRGTGWSAEVFCSLSVTGLFDSSPETWAELEALDGLLADTMIRCRDQAPQLTKISSNRVVDDMEALRVHFGEEKLDFIGFSYGTRLGSLYAEAYPDRVGHIVLDAATSPQADTLESLEGKHRFATDRVNELIAACETCNTGFEQDLAELLTELDGHPMGVVLGGELRHESQLRGYLSQAILGDVTAFEDMVVPMVHRDWAALDAALAARPEPEALAEDMFIRAMIVNCLDDASIPTVDEVWAMQSAGQEDSVVAGLHWTALACGHLLTEDELDPFPVVRAKTSPPILVVGGTADGNTPYAWSVEMAEALDHSVLITSEHVGHTVLGNSPCVDDYVSAFLLHDVVPATNVDCLAP